MKVLFVCPSLCAATGNTSTVTRIQKHLNSAGIPCLLEEMDTLAQASNGCPLKFLHNFIQENDISGVLLLHAFKCAKAVLCDCGEMVCPKLNVPYCFIFGGTDLNVDSHDKEKCSIMRKALYGAMCAIAFTHDMKQCAQKISPSTIILISPQAIEVQHIADSAIHLDSMQAVNSSLLFILVTSIRPVKDPVFVLEKWTELSRAYPELGLKLLIIGPILDEQYYIAFTEQIEKLQGKYIYHTDGMADSLNLLQKICAWVTDKNSFPIAYSSPLPKDAYNTLMSTYVFASINSSESEGMSSAVLESMALGIPVIAREIPGNCAVVTESKTGLLFDTPMNFVEQTKRLLFEPTLRSSIVKNASDYISVHHSIKKERQFYVELCQQYFH